MLMKLLLIAHVLILMIYVNMGKPKAQQKDYFTAESKPGVKFQSLSINPSTLNVSIKKILMKFKIVSRLRRFGVFVSTEKFWKGKDDHVFF